MSGITFSTYSALYLAPSFNPPGLALTGDALVKLYAAAYRDALRNMPECLEEMRDQTAEVRAEHPEATVSEVTVVLADGEHRFTWDEFELWCNSAEVAP